MARNTTERFAVSLKNATHFRKVSPYFALCGSAHFFSCPSVVAGGFLTIGNAATDISCATIDAVIAQTKDAILGSTSNTYNLNALDLLALKRAQLGLSD
jgi:hypothetical protein